MRRSAAWASLFARHLLLAQRTSSPILHLTAKRAQPLIICCTGSIRCLSQETMSRNTPKYSSHDDVRSIPYSTGELIPGPEMLHRIVSDIQQKGITFILPVNDEMKMNELVEPLANFIKIGLRPEFLIDECVKQPDLFKKVTTKGRDSWKIAKLLADNCEIAFEDSLRMLASYSDDLLSSSPIAIQSRLDAIIACGITAGRQLGRIVRNCPAVMFARDIDGMRRAAEALSAFFTRKEIVSIIVNCPQILLQNVEEVEKKYEYIYYRMCVEGEGFMNCIRWPEIPLEEIINRHEFLLKCGRYITPDPKHPQSKMENPELRRILDSSDYHFAVQVAGVSEEEWIIYRTLSIKMMEQSGKEYIFEKVKPSMRKAYERRRKEKKLSEEHIFDTSLA